MSNTEIVPPKKVPPKKVQAKKVESRKLAYNKEATGLDLIISNNEEDLELLKQYKEIGLEDLMRIRKIFELIKMINSISIPIISKQFLDQPTSKKLTQLTQGASKELEKFKEFYEKYIKQLDVEGKNLKLKYEEAVIEKARLENLLDKIDNS